MFVSTQLLVGWTAEIATKDRTEQLLDRIRWFAQSIRVD